jgi:hypothetical protein
MRYGGELVNAEDCDYGDFKRLIPLCPNCGEPVFLRKSCDRVSKLGKPFVIPKHWAHFDSASEEQKAACEARVSGYTEADRQRIQSQARGQRLKLIQRWFWKILYFHLWNGPLDQIEKLAQEISITSEAPERYLFFLPADRRLFEGEGFCVEDFLSSVEEVQGGGGVEPDWALVEDPKEFRRDHAFSADLPAKFKVHMAVSLIGIQESVAQELSQAKTVSTWLDGYCKSRNRSALDAKICEEAVQFICARKNRSLLNSAISAAFVVLSNSERGHWFVEVIASGYSVSHATACAICMIISEAPWASEFARLEAESRQGVAA